MNLKMIQTDFRTAMLMLRYSSPQDLKALVLDLRGNPGGLLDAAVELASYLVPAHSDIVSSRSREGIEIVYRSVAEPIRPPGMKLVVLVNRGSASAAEIVSGAVQDLDAGIIVGPTRTYGKGLVQKVAPLPFDSALKYTVARYYTPSGRCIQGKCLLSTRPGVILTCVAINYKGGRELASLEPSPLEKDGAEKIAEADRKTFFTSQGRPVKDGGGVEPDVLVPESRAGPAESVLVSQGVFSDFADHYLRSSPVDLRQRLRGAVEEEQRRRRADPRLAGVIHINSMMQYLFLDSSPTAGLSRARLWEALLPDQPGAVTSDKLFASFKRYVEEQVRENKVRVDAGAGAQVEALERTLQAQGFDSVADEVDTIRARLLVSLLADLSKHREDVLDDIELALLSREFPDRLLFYRNVLRDPQVQAAVKIALDPKSGTTTNAPVE